MWTVASPARAWTKHSLINYSISNKIMVWSIMTDLSNYVIIWHKTCWKTGNSTQKVQYLQYYSPVLNTYLPIVHSVSWLFNVIIWHKTWTSKTIWHGNRFGHWIFLVTVICKTGKTGNSTQKMQYLQYYSPVLNTYLPIVLWVSCSMLHIAKQTKQFGMGIDRTLNIFSYSNM